MNEVKFNTQICTTCEQSKRLLDLGLKPETADMYIFDDEVYIGKPNIDDIPAWSLHRLLEIICNIECEEQYYFDFSVDYDSMEDVYDSIIEVIERHIKNGYFNKEYLKR